MQNIEQAAVEVREELDALASVFPELRPQLEKQLAQQMVEALAPLTELVDVLEGRLTREEYERREAERQKVDIGRRQSRFGEPGPDGTYDVVCEECGADLQMHELPNLYPECEDIGEECQA